MNHIDLNNKFKSFGFYTSEVDGHNIDTLISAFNSSFANSNQQPIAIIANTVKGKGISFMENNKEWHHSVLSKNQYLEALSELGGSYGNK